MFEAGRTYHFVTYDHDGDAHWSAKVDEVEGPLIKFNRGNGETIFNTHCPSFKSARLWSREEEEQAASDEAEWGDLLARPTTSSDGR